MSIYWRVLLGSHEEEPGAASTVWAQQTAPRVAKHGGARVQGGGAEEEAVAGSGEGPAGTGR